MHTLRDRDKAKKVWSMIAIDHDQAFYSSNHGDWLSKYATKANGELFVIVCWCIWKSRNSEIFTDTVWSDWYMTSCIQSLHDSIIKAFGSSQNSKLAREVKWSPPLDNYIKLNMDGSFFGNPGRSGFGGIFRNSIGEWMLGFTASCGVSTNLNA